MNKEWSIDQKEAMLLFKKEKTFNLGKEKLLALRNILMMDIDCFKSQIKDKDFSKQPFINHNSYESKTVAYSLYHIFRIEDIVCHQLILKDEEVYKKHNYQNRMNASIKTTGNELQKEEIAIFSNSLNIKELYMYIHEVKDSVDQMILSLNYSDLKRKFTEEDKKKLISSHSVSENELAFWLIDFWCSKNVLGLLGMPFSRHWIMHIEASHKIINKILKEKNS